MDKCGATLRLGTTADITIAFITLINRGLLSLKEQLVNLLHLEEFDDLKHVLHRRFADFRDVAGLLNSLLDTYKVSLIFVLTKHR